MNEDEYEELDRQIRNIGMSEKYDRPVYEDEVSAEEWHDMKEIINDCFVGDFDSEHFHDAIWRVSTEMLNEKEVSVVVDRDNQLFISKGTRSFVDYEDESVAGMKIPLRCWLHTHPFGVAYFSGTDWGTINTQGPILESAIVLGDNQKMKWWKKNGKEMLCKTEMIKLSDSEE